MGYTYRQFNKDSLEWDYHSHVYIDVICKHAWREILERYGEVEENAFIRALMRVIIQATFHELMHNVHSGLIKEEQVMNMLKKLKMWMI